MLSSFRSNGIVSHLFFFSLMFLEPKMTPHLCDRSLQILLCIHVHDGRDAPLTFDESFEARAFV